MRDMLYTDCEAIICTASLDMTAVEPTYPLFPVACFVAAAMLLLVLWTSFIRQSWNLGVAFLCIWLFLETLAEGIEAVIWSDNADIKLYVFCDIGERDCCGIQAGSLTRVVTHIQLITYVVKPMASLLITRRLYLITSLQSVELPDSATVRIAGTRSRLLDLTRTLVQKRRNLVLEWTLGLVVPVLIAGPFCKSYIYTGTLRTHAQARARLHKPGSSVSGL